MTPELKILFATIGFIAGWIFGTVIMAIASHGTSKGYTCPTANNMDEGVISRMTKVEGCTSRNDAVCKIWFDDTKEPCYPIHRLPHFPVKVGDTSCVPKK